MGLNGKRVGEDSGFGRVNAYMVNLFERSRGLGRVRAIIMRQLINILDREFPCTNILDLE
jgi:hypothetical protein